MERLQRLAEGLEAAASDATIPDHRLALMFTCAHPAIDAGIRAPLMLQAVLGLDAKRIASAFLTSPAAMGQATRAREGEDPPGRHPLSRAGARRAARPARAVLDAIYAAFAEGWTDAGGTDRRAPRPDRGGAVPGPTRDGAAAGGARSPGPARADAPRGGATPRAARRGRRVRAARGAGSRVVGRGA